MRKDKDTLPIMEEIKQAAAEPGVPDTIADFERAISDRLFAGYDHIEVTERIFKHYCVDPNTNYFTYGKPGIKVYRVGTKAEFDKIDRMKPEDYAAYLNNKRALN